MNAPFFKYGAFAVRAAEELAHPGLAHESIEEIVEELEAQAEHDPVMRSKLHED